MNQINSVGFCNKNEYLCYYTHVYVLSSLPSSAAAGRFLSAPRPVPRTSVAHLFFRMFCCWYFSSIAVELTVVVIYTHTQDTNTFSKFVDVSSFFLLRLTFRFFLFLFSLFFRLLFCL